MATMVRLPLVHRDSVCGHMYGWCRIWRLPEGSPAAYAAVRTWDAPDVAAMLDCCFKQSKAEDDSMGQPQPASVMEMVSRHLPWPVYRYVAVPAQHMFLATRTQNAVPLQHQPFWPT